MRKLPFLMLVLQVSVVSLEAQVFANDASITIRQKQISIREVLRQITIQTGFDFSYNSDLVDVDQMISFRVKNASTEETLSALAKIIDIDYVLVEDQIVLRAIRAHLKDLPKEDEVLYTISGFVKEKTSGESLIGATIMVVGTSAGVVSNAFGYYSLRLREGKHTLSFSYLGYESMEINLTIDQDLRKDVSLDYASLDLPNVVVALPTQQVLKNRDLGQMNLRPSELDNMPEFAGESGLVKGLQSLAGIKTHSDGSAFFYVRGGEKDQNLIIIDDAPIFNPSHLFGFYSMVIPEFTKDIQVYKSDIPVNLGDRLSSIVSIRTKDGNLNRLSFSGSLNPLVNRLSLELPLVKGKSSIFASLRRSNFEWIIRQSNPDLKLEFGDFNFKWNYAINQRNRLFFTLITGVDALQNTTIESSGVDWGNVATTLRWNHVFGSNLFSNTTLYSGSYRYRIGIADNSWESAIGMISLKSDFTHFISNNIESKFGLEFSAFGFNAGKLSSGSLLSFIPDVSAGIAGKRIAYYQTNIALSSKWHVGAGFRLSTWANRGPAEYFTYDAEYKTKENIKITSDSIFDTHLNFDPRLSLQYFPDSTLKLKLSLGRYHQYLQLISNSVSPFTSVEVWLPSGPNISPQTANEISLDISKYLSHSQTEFGVAAYIKNFENQIDYVPHASTFLNPEIEGQLRFGKMQSYGLEFMIKKRLGKINGWVNYTWSRALRQTDAVNGGLQYPAFQDRPHDFSLMLNYQFTKRVLVSTYYTAYTGSAFSAPTGFYTFNDQKIPIYQQKNNDRLPNYRRLDVACKFRLNRDLTKRYQHSLILSLYNILRHNNVVGINFNKVLNGQGEPVVPANFVYEKDFVTTQTDLIRFMPSLTYKFNW